MQVNNTQQQQQKARRVLTTTAGPVATHIVVEESTVCTHENRFSEPEFSEIINLMNIFSSFFHILLFILTQFSK